MASHVLKRGRSLMPLSQLLRASPTAACGMLEVIKKVPQEILSKAIPASSIRMRTYADAGVRNAEETDTDPSNLTPCETNWEQHQEENEVDKALKDASQRGHGAVLEVVGRTGEGLNERNVVTAFKQLAASTRGMKEEEVLDNVHPDHNFQALIDIVLMGLQRYPVPALTSIVRACGQLRYEGDMLLDEISRHIVEKLADTDAQHLVDLATGLAEADHSPSILLFDAIQRRAQELQSGFSAEQKAALEEAYKSFGYEHDL